MQNLLLEIELDAIHISYEENQNPLLLWRALKLCLDEKYPVPDWVSDYFLDVASKFLKLSDIAKRENFDDIAASEVYKTLGMSKPGAGTFFSNYSELKRDTKIIREYYQFTKVDEDGKADGRMGHNKAVTEIAEKRNVSESLVNKVIYGSREKLGDLPENYEFESNEWRKRREKNKALRKKKALEKQKLQT